MPASVDRAVQMTSLEALRKLRALSCATFGAGGILIDIGQLILELEELAELKANQVSDEPVDLTARLRRERAYWAASRQGLSEQECLNAMRRE